VDIRKLSRSGRSKQSTCNTLVIQMEDSESQLNNSNNLKTPNIRFSFFLNNFVGKIGVYFSGKSVFIKNPAGEDIHK